MNGHVRLPWMLNSGQITFEDIVKDIESQANALTHTVILSAEDWCLVKNDSFFDRLGAEYDLEAILYLKRQDLWLESWYNQHVKWPWEKRFSSATPQEFLSDYKDDFWWMSYDKLIEKIERNVGNGRLHIDVVDPLGTSDTVEDFLKCVGIEPLWMNSYKNENTSLSSAKLDLLRRIDLYELSAPERVKMLDAINALDMPEDNGRKEVFSNEQLIDISQSYENSNALVAKKYFSRDRLFSPRGERSAEPVFLSDEVAYKRYIPELLKILVAR